MAWILQKRQILDGTKIKCRLCCQPNFGSFQVHFTVGGSSKQIWLAHFWRGHPSPKSFPWALSHTDMCQMCHECMKHSIWLAKLTGFRVVPVVDFILFNTSAEKSGSSPRCLLMKDVFNEHLIKEVHVLFWRSPQFRVSLLRGSFH